MNNNKEILRHEVLTQLARCKLYCEDLSAENVDKLKSSIESVILYSSFEDIITGKERKKIVQEFYPNEFLEEFAYSHPDSSSCDSELLIHETLFTDTFCLYKVLMPWLRELNRKCALHVWSNRIEIKWEKGAEFKSAPSTLECIQIHHTLEEIQFALSFDLCASMGWEIQIGAGSITLLFV